MAQDRAKARRVLVVSHEASRTGAPRVAVHLCSVFARVGWQVSVALRWGGPLRPEFEAVADEVIDEPWSRLRAALLRNRHTKRLVPVLQRSAARRVLRRVRPDLVWCNTVISAPYAVAAAERGLPSVVHSHEHAEVVGRSLERTGLRTVLHGNGSARPRLVACAPATGDVLAEAAGVDRSEVVVIHSPVDVDVVRESANGVADGSDGPPLVVAAGLGNHSKGVDVFCEAARVARRRSSAARWRWVGDVVVDVGQAPVEFPGSRPSAAADLAEASVVALPSRADAFPLVVLEAMALGRPVVASDLPGPREQLGDTGVLVPPGDPAALADAVEALLADPERARRLGRAASRRCEELWDVAPFSAAVLTEAARVMGSPVTSP